MEKGFVVLLKDSDTKKHLITSAPTDCVKREMERLEASYNVHLLCDHMIPTDDRIQLHNELVEKYDDKRGKYGWFQLEEADVKYIQSLKRVDYHSEEAV